MAAPGSPLAHPPTTTSRHHPAPPGRITPEAADPSSPCGNAAQEQHEAGVIQVGGADILMAMTSIGDGFFPVHLDVDVDGLPVALRIDVTGEG